MSTALDDRIGGALERRTDPPMDVDLDAVRRGARHRRTRRRVTTTLAAVLLVGGATGVIATRDAAERTPEAPATAPEPPAFGAAALLSADVFGPPTEVGAYRSTTQNIDLPQIDVWESAAGRIVVHTYRASDFAPEEIGVVASTVPATTEVPAAGDVVDISGAASGVVERLADDQWVLYLTPEREQGDFVIARGMPRGGAERAFRALVTVDGVLQPADGYELVEHVDARPPSAPSGWWTQLGFGEWAGFGNTADTWVSVWEPPAPIDSLELATVFPSAMLDAGGHEVARITVNDHQSSYAWRDPRGLIVTVWSFVDQVDPGTIGDVIDGTRLIGPAEFIRIAGSISAARAAEPVVGSAVVGDVTITLRGTPKNVVLCVGSGVSEQCSRDINASINEPPINSTIDAVVDGHWVIAGVREVDPGGDPVDLADDRYTLPDGTDAPITVVESGGRLWWTAIVPDDVDTITTHWENDAGGIVGPITRPIVVGALG